MLRSKGEGVQTNLGNKDIEKQKDKSKNRVVVGLVTSFSCPHCDEAFDQKTTLSKHLKSHQPTNQGMKEPITKEPIAKDDSRRSEEKENLPDKKAPVLKHLKVIKPKVSGSKSRLEVLRVSSATKSLISPASGGRTRVRRVLRKKSASLPERPKLAAKQSAEEEESTDGIGPKRGTKPETDDVRNGSPGQSGLMYPGWHASAAGSISQSSGQIFGYTDKRVCLFVGLFCYLLSKDIKN